MTIVSQARNAMMRGRDSGRSDEQGVVLPLVIVTILVLVIMATNTLRVADQAIARSVRDGQRNTARLAAQSAIELIFTRLNQNPDSVDATLGTVNIPGLIQGRWYAQNGNILVDCPSGGATCMSVFFEVETPAAGKFFDPRAVTVTAVGRTGCRGKLSANTVSLTTCQSVTLRQTLRERQAFAFMYFDRTQTLDPRFYRDPSDRSIAYHACARPNELAPTAYPTRLPTFSDRAAVRNAFYTTTSGSTFAGPTPGYTAATPRFAGTSRDISVPLFDCQEVPYFGDGVVSGVVDELSGPVHTNDEYVLYCGNPKFVDGTPARVVRDRVEASVDPAQVVAPDPSPLRRLTNDEVFRGSTACNVGAVSLGSFDEARNQPYDIPIAPNAISNVVDNADKFVGDQTIVVTETGYSIGGVDRVSRTGTVYVNGDVYVSGATCTSLSIQATGSIFITGDLLNAQQFNSAAPRVSPFPCAAYKDWPTSMIGLLASGGSVVVQPPRVGPSGPIAVAQMTIQAAVVALGKPDVPNPTSPQVADQIAAGGSFSVDQWWIENTPGATPVLNFEGSIWSKYRGAYAAFDTLGPNGIVMAGFKKNFVFDQRLRSLQPPYLVSATRANWVRGDLAQVGLPTGMTTNVV
jgi:hypothetical protein